MLDNLTVKQKLLLGFSTVLILLVLMAGTGLKKMGDIHENVVEITRDRAPKIELVNDMLKNTLDNGRLIRNAVFVGPDQVEKSLKQVDENRQQNTDDMVKLEALLSLPKGREIFARITTARAELATHYTHVYTLVRADDDKAATDYILSTFAPANNRFMATLYEMEQFQLSLMAASRDKAEASYPQAKVLILTLGAVALLVGITIAILISRQIATALQKAMVQADRIASGNLTPNPDALVPASRNEINMLLGSLETMRTKLADAVGEIQNSTSYVSDSARELSRMSNQVATSAQQQAESTSSAAATLEELTVGINHVADNASDASGQASHAGTLAKQGSRDVELSVSRIQTVSHSVEETATEMNSLTKEVQEIGNIVTVIRDVADQTNLLALNAAIEAARAGEMGRGFAVVADEVRKLAERTTVSAQEITRMVSSIQQNASRVVSSMEQSRQSVGGVTESASRTSDVMNQVQDSANAVLNAVGNINGALTEQRSASQELAKNMESVAQMAEKNSTTVEALAATSNQLSGQAQNLQGIVSRFRLN